MSEQELRQILGEMLERDNDAEISVGAGLVFSRWEGRRLDPPVRLLLRDGELSDVVKRYRDDALELWPRKPPELGALGLLSIHIEEAFAVGPMGKECVTELVIHRGGVWPRVTNWK